MSIQASMTAEDIFFGRIKNFTYNFTVWKGYCFISLFKKSQLTGNIKHSGNTQATTQDLSRQHVMKHCIDLTVNYSFVCMIYS